MIIKKSWIEILAENNVGVYALNQTGIINLIESIDDLFTKQVDKDASNYYSIKNIYSEIINHFVTNVEEDNYWADMPVYLSSYNFKNKAPFGEVILRLTQYLGFYKKILENSGLARKVITHREFSNEGHSQGVNKNLNSDTPQVKLTSFDDMIEYVSQANKSEDKSDSSTKGDSDLVVISKSFDEEEKNLKIIFYNDLCDYIRKLPHWLYSQYALDSLPSKAIAEETFKYFKQLYERR